jgi:hypothetical protein
VAMEHTMSFERPRDPSTDPERRRAVYGGNRGGGKTVTLREQQKAEREASEAVAEDVSRGITEKK